jgi:hypothetical protein
MTASYTPLHGPDDDAPKPAALDLELAATRQVLDETAALNIHDPAEMLTAAVRLNIRLRNLLAALDTDGIR